MARTSWFSFVPAALLAFAFFMAGQAKLTAVLTPDVHAELVGKAPSWHAALPLLVPPPPASLYAIGGTEVVLALALLVPALRRWAALAAVALMGGAMLTHALLDEPVTAPAVLLAVAAVTWIVSGKPARSAGKKRQ